MLKVVLNKVTIEVPTSVLILYLVTIALILSACEDPGSPPVIPEPEIVSEAGPVTSLDAVYYQITPQEEARQILAELLSADFEIRDAWYPTEGSPCLCVTCVHAMVLELKSPDARVLDFDFIADSAQFVINCGVDEFEHYQFIPDIVTTR